MKLSGALEMYSPLHLNSPITSKVSLWMRINYLKIKAKMSTEQ